MSDGAASSGDWGSGDLGEVDEPRSAQPVLRVSDLIGRSVQLGTSFSGRVSGLRCVQDGPIIGAQAALRVESLVVHRRRVGAFLGYQFRDQGRPVLLGWLLNWVHRDAILVPVDEIADLTAEPLVRAASRPADQP